MCISRGGGGGRVPVAVFRSGFLAPIVVSETVYYLSCLFYSKGVFPLLRFSQTLHGFSNVSICVIERVSTPCCDFSKRLTIGYAVRLVSSLGFLPLAVVPPDL